MKNSYKKLLLTSILIIAIILFFRFIKIERYINFQVLKENREYLFDLVKDYYWISVLIYIFIYILVAAFSIPVSVPLTLISGFLFGILPAVIYTNIGATIGAIITFLIIRYFLGNKVQRTYQEKLVKFNKNMEIYGANYLLLARFIAIIPFFLVNILVALTKIPLKTFIWTTSLGIIPGSIVYTYAGKHIISINSAKEIFSSKIILAFVILILFGLTSIFIKKVIATKRNKIE